MRGFIVDIQLVPLDNNNEGEKRTVLSKTLLALKAYFKDSTGRPFFSRIKGTLIIPKTKRGDMS